MPHARRKKEKLGIQSIDTYVHTKKQTHPARVNDWFSAIYMHVAYQSLILKQQN